MGWTVQFRIAFVCFRIRSDSDHFRQEIGYLTSLYEPDQQSEPDVVFHIEHRHPFFTLRLGETLIWQSEEPRDIPAAIEVHIYRQALSHIGEEHLSLHAASVALGDKACIFAGISGAGKSSLCTAALLSGAPYLTDEFSLLGRDGRIHPFPRPLQWETIDHPAFTQTQLLGSSLFKKGQFSFPDPKGSILTSHLWLPENIQRHPLRAGYLILPRYNADAPPACLKSIRRSQALMALPEHLHFRLPPAEMIRQLNHRLPQDIQTFELEFSDVYAAWRSVQKLNMAT